jgi:hypothetical protein
MQGGNESTGIVWAMVKSAVARAVIDTIPLHSVRNLNILEVPFKVTQCYALECFMLLTVFYFALKALGVDFKLNSNSEVRKPFCPDGIKAHATLPANANFNISRRYKAAMPQNCMCQASI